MRTALVLAFLALALPARALPRDGALGGGFHLDLLQLGLAEGFAAGGGTAGLALNSGVALDLKGGLSLQLPVRLSVGGDATLLSLSPGLEYRFRGGDSRGWIPFAGAGLLLGLAGAQRSLLDLPLQGLLCRRGLYCDWDGGDSGPPDPNLETDLVAALSLHGGVELRRSAWFAWRFELSMDVMSVAGVTLAVLRQTVGMRLSL